MNVAQPDRQSVPLLRGNEEQPAKLRKRLEEVLGNVSLAHDVVVVCIELSQDTFSDFNTEVAHVLRRCVADKLYFQMSVLTNVIEQLGRKTAYSNTETANPGRANA